MCSSLEFAVLMVVVLCCEGLAKRVKGKILLSSTSEVYGDPEV